MAIGQETEINWNIKLPQQGRDLTNSLGFVKQDILTWLDLTSLDQLTKIHYSSVEPFSLFNGRERTQDTSFRTVPVIKSRESNCVSTS